MNDTKWHAILEVIAAEDVPCRIKLLYHDYFGDSKPGAEVITCYDEQGRPGLLRAGRVWRATPKYWDSASLGPFVPREIEWIAMSTSSFAAIRDQLPKNLPLSDDGQQTIISGYSY